MRKFLIAGNWKMFHTPKEAAEYGRKLAHKNPDQYDIDVLLCPPALSLPALRETLRHTKVAVGGQNIHQEPKGAFTGEMSAEMYKDAGASYVLVGHSERRQYFGETDELVRSKTIRALEAGLTPLVCIGETLDERKNNQTSNVILTQLNGAFKHFSKSDMSKIVIAYEPVWAIGTGKTATPEQAQELHLLIRRTIELEFDAALANDMRILYGGSVKVENARDLLSRPDIDGALIGGASLKVDDFHKIIEIAHQL
ncbi:MAG TPA: triose-phosphate isomerase [Candidatus Marinimicrobia bacterium]|nr:triose-phosphate isomerase [Candidatus Neomarinimicrobiota bacterium]